MVNVLFFGQLKEQLGMAQIEVNCAESLTVADIKNQVVEMDSRFPALFEDGRILVAVNQEMSDAGQTVVDGDEVAFFPPVTGG